MPHMSWIDWLSVGVYLSLVWGALCWWFGYRAGRASKTGSEAYRDEIATIDWKFIRFERRLTWVAALAFAVWSGLWAYFSSWPGHAVVFSLAGVVGWSVTMWTTVLSPKRRRERAAFYADQASRRP